MDVWFSALVFCLHIPFLLCLSHSFLPDMSLPIAFSPYKYYIFLPLISLSSFLSHPSNYAHKNTYVRIQPYRPTGMLVLDNSSKPWIMFNKIFFDIQCQHLKCLSFYDIWWYGINGIPRDIRLQHQFLRCQKTVSLQMVTIISSDDYTISANRAQPDS